MPMRSRARRSRSDCAPPAAMSAVPRRASGCPDRHSTGAWSVLVCGPLAAHDRRMRFSLEGKLAALLGVVFVVAVAATALLVRRFDNPTDALMVLIVLLAVAVPVILWLARRTVAPLNHLLRAMHGAIASYRDGEFSLSLAVDRRDLLGELLEAHNELGRALREQRQHLVQRELLLDTMTQNS